MDSYNIPPACLRAILIGSGVGLSGTFIFAAALPIIGFSTAGPTAGSLAAFYQSIIGGKVASGSIFALLQSAGMAGLSFQTGVIVTGASASLAYTICNSLGYENGC
ncbi:hypothetical protein BJ944DRAFT_263905 [Cunninghamella echinulata]|nr:hypothetical protein BJ944DRAFT_263905 [Cunninghamella echinulata]